MDLLDRLKVAAQVAMNPAKHTEDILQLLLTSVDHAILIGFAKKIGDETFSVSNVVGDKAEQLTGLEFCVGEGYLGYVVATAKPGYWSNVSKDPRGMCFERHGIHPESVVCCPVVQQQEVIGVLFGALSGDANKKVRIFLELVSIMFGRQMQLNSLEENLQVRTVRLAALLELSQAIRTVEDVKNILYIILDMSLNLVQGPFSCIAFQPLDQDSSVELITRGIPRQKAAQYGRELVTSYIGRTAAEFKNQTIPVIRTVGTVSVIECPLFVQHKVIAVLAAAVDVVNTLNEFTQLVYALSAVAGAALQRIYSDNADDWMKEISLIHKVSAFWSKGDYHHASNIQELTMEFTKYLGWSEASTRDIGQAALLTPYDMMFVQEALSDIPEQIRQAICEYRMVLESSVTDSTSLSEASQILLMVAHHLGNVDISMDFNNIGLREKFEQFLLRSRIESQQILLDEPQNPVQMKAQPLSGLSIAEQLTAREQEILQLLVTGKGNKEIAQTLFISEHTVKNHMTNIYQKLGVTDRTQAVAFVLGQLQ